MAPCAAGVRKMRTRRTGIIRLSLRGAGHYTKNDMPNGSTRGTILFADDERALTALFAAHLRRANFDVKIALDGAEARDVFLVDPASFDLLIADSCMPNLSGIELGKIAAQQGCPVL